LALPAAEARHPEGVGVTPWRKPGQGGRSFSPRDGRSPIHPTRDVPFPPRRTSRYRKWMISDPAPGGQEIALGSRNLRPKGEGTSHGACRLDGPGAEKWLGQSGEVWTVRVGGGSVCVSFKKRRTDNPQEPQHGRLTSSSGRAKAENFWACGLHQALSMKRTRDDRLR
jgi:hypothetical protein